MEDPTVNEPDKQPSRSAEPDTQGSVRQPPHKRHRREVPYEPVHGSNWWFVAHRRFSVVGIALTVMLLIWVGLQLLVMSGLNLFYPNTQLPLWLELTLSNGPLYVIAMPVAWLILNRLPVLPTRQFAMGASRFWSLLIMCVPIMYAGSFIGSLLSSVLSQGQSVNQISELIDRSDPLTSIAFMVVIAPVFEEWMFRKQIIDHIRQYGEKPAIFLSALAFALFHLNLFQFFYAFGLGLVFGYVYVRTSRLRYSLAMHMMVNFNAAVILPLVLSTIDSTTLDALESGSPQQVEDALEHGAPGLIGYGIYAMVIVALVIAGIILLIQRRKSFEFYTTPEELPRGLHARTSLLNPGVVTYICLCLAVSVLQFLLM